MEEYTQITLDQWVQWKEDIRRKLQETAGNFVYIGYRLKQIRDSGMYDGCENVFEWAEKEYGLNKSTVSRFIAVNEKYSEGGNSLELKEEYRGFSQSQLTEMLTLPDSECELITEQTTVKEIRELKNFVKEEKELVMNPPEERCQEAGEEDGEGSQEAAGADNMPDWTPLQKCIIDYFKDKKELIEKLIEVNSDKEASELLAPSGNTCHKKGTVFIFMYDYSRGVAYKQMGQPEPVKMRWSEFCNEINKIYFGLGNWRKQWDEIYTKDQAKTAAPTACQPAKPVDVWKDEPVSESARKSDQIEAENDQKETESDQNVPESVRNEPETVSEPQKTSEIVKEPQKTESEPVVTSQQKQINPEYEEIVQRYDMMLKNLDEIRERMKNMLWDDAYNILLRLKGRMEEMVDGDPKLIKEALESVYDND